MPTSAAADARAARFGVPGRIAEDALRELAGSLLGEKKGLDAEKFRQLLSEYYQVRGWEVGTGWPTRAKSRRR